MENLPIRWLGTVRCPANTITTNTCTNAITNGHAYTAHAESHFIAHASPSPTWLAIAVGSLPRD
jgi:hypothetical protein